MAQIHISPIYEHNLTSQNTFYLQCTYCGNKQSCELNDMTKFIYKEQFFMHICKCRRSHYFKKDDLVLLYTKMYIDSPVIVKHINDAIDPITKQIKSSLLNDNIIDTATDLFNQYMQFMDILEST
jgi:hypothetical protein